MNIYVVPQIMQNEVQEISFELVGLAKEVAQALNGGVITLLLGRGVANLVPQFGLSDKVLLIDNEKLQEFSPELYQKVLITILKERRPDLVFLGHTTVGMDIAGNLSVNLDLPMVTFCKGIRVENGGLVITSLLYGGKLFIDSRLKGDKGILLFTPGVYPAEKGKVEKRPQIEEVSFPEIEVKTHFEKYILPEITDVDISKEEILVSVGRGIQNKDNIGLAEELAQVLGGVVSASRPVIDQGWLPKTRQVGRSGKTVRPKLYLTLGISGAPEHLEGLGGAELIIAVNTDKNAPIFNVAHYGVVRDLFEIIPLLKERIQELKGK